MRTVTDLPHEVRDLEHVEITVRDGTRLAARIWLPEDAEERPVPAILEYIPYRRLDGTRLRDEIHHPYLAAHGYAAARVDLRGSGDSAGRLTDEYTRAELDDGEDVIAWLADQPWCDGTVGAMGISWGGFNALQLAARRPPALGAVITVASTDDRYRDDVHYMGGCLLGDNLSWASTMFAYNSLPPDPMWVPDWRERWLDRLDGCDPWLDTWLRHQHRDDYWRHGSVCEDPDAIDVPVMAVSGWADGYTNAVFRLLEQRKAPTQALVGPWSHRYPHLGEPGPAIGWLQECVRWWDHWLKGVDNGADREPALRAWLQDSEAPFASYHERPGRWVTEPSWPSPHTRWRTHALAPGRILAEGSEPQAEDPLPLRSPLTLGVFAGKWCSYAGAPDLPGDQQEEDGGALTFDTARLTEDVEILGAPVVELELSSDRPVAMVAVRLSDIRPDNQITRVTYGLLNLTHRDGHADPRPLVPGERVLVRVQLNDIGCRFPAGHRIRLAVSSSYWPLAWLPPEPVQLLVDPSRCRLHLPIRPAREEPPVWFGPPEGSPPSPATVIAPGESVWRVLRDLGSDRSTLEVVKDTGRVRLDDADHLVVGSRAVERYTVEGDDVTSARAESVWDRSLERGDWHIRTVSRTTLTADGDHFRIRASLDAYEGDQRIRARDWDRSIERRLL
jgi:putative CocE/NonD family hydrolase